MIWRDSHLLRWTMDCLPCLAYLPVDTPRLFTRDGVGRVSAPSFSDPRRSLVFTEHRAELVQRFNAKYLHFRPNACFVVLHLYSYMPAACDDRRLHHPTAYCMPAFRFRPRKCLTSIEDARTSERRQIATGHHRQTGCGHILPPQL